MDLFSPEKFSISLKLVLQNAKTLQTDSINFYGMKEAESPLFAFLQQVKNL
jgi:hypothetical protein